MKEKKEKGIKKTTMEHEFFGCERGAFSIANESEGKGEAFLS